MRLFRSNDKTTSAFQTRISHPSRMLQCKFAGKPIWVKRDDELSTHYPGNKWRKLYSSFEKLKSPSSSYTHAVSCGGNQSNAMLAIAHFASSEGVKFNYYSRPLSKALKENPQGNLKKSLELGMNLIEDDRKWEEIQQEWKSDSTLYFPPGICSNLAKEGIYRLGEELTTQITELLDKETPTAVVLPSGTGVSSFFLAQYFHNSERVKVFTVSVAVPEASLQNDFDKMKKWAGVENEGQPIILQPKKRYNFAQPHMDLKNMHCALKRTGINFDLIYATVTWKGMLDNWDQLRPYQIIYIHTGGVEGNETQLKRYPQSSCPAENSSA